MTASSKFVWFEYVSSDAAKAQGFFGELFNWTTQSVPMPDGPYTMIAASGRTIGGYLPTPAGAPPHAHWLSHLSVADAKASSSQAVALGGKLLKPATKIGEFGTMAVVADPQGGVFALWQPTKAEPQPAPTTGTFCWTELHSSDAAASVAYYTALAGLTPEAMETPGMGAYTVLNGDGAARGGIVPKQMPQAPHAWLPYVQVTSADATSERGKKLGGTVVVPPTDVPGVGRFAILIDPQGAAIGILQP